MEGCPKRDPLCLAFVQDDVDAFRSLVDVDGLKYPEDVKTVETALEHDSRAIFAELCERTGERFTDEMLSSLSSGVEIPWSKKLCDALAAQKNERLRDALREAICEVDDPVSMLTLLRKGELHEEHLENAVRLWLVRNQAVFGLEISQFYSANRKRMMTRILDPPEHDHDPSPVTDLMEEVACWRGNISNCFWQVKTLSDYFSEKCWFYLEKQDGKPRGTTETKKGSLEHATEHYVVKEWDGFGCKHGKTRGVEPKAPGSIGIDFGPDHLIGSRPVVVTILSDGKDTVGYDRVPEWLKKSLQKIAELKDEMASVAFETPVLMDPRTFRKAIEEFALDTGVRAAIYDAREPDPEEPQKKKRRTERNKTK